MEKNKQLMLDELRKMRFNEGYMKSVFGTEEFRSRKTIALVRNTQKLVYYAFANRAADSGDVGVVQVYVLDIVCIIEYDHIDTKKFLNSAVGKFWWEEIFMPLKDKYFPEGVHLVK